MSKKGLSLEEKRTKMLEIFHESATFHKLQDIEKSAPKLKGIVQQSVKDVLQGLVDDGLVTMEKIGTSNFYWSFPSASEQKKKTELANLQQEFDRANTIHTQLETQLESYTTAMETDDDNSNNTETQRVALQQELEQLVKEEKRLEQELKKFSDSDPLLFKAQKLLSEKAKTSANQWTENIFEFQSYCINTLNVDRGDFNRNFNIPDDFDTI